MFELLTILARSLTLLALIAAVLIAYALITNKENPK